MEALNDEKIPELNIRICEWYDNTIVIMAMAVMLIALALAFALRSS